MAGSSLSLRERFEAKWTTIPETACWWWVSETIQGYGYVRKEGKKVKAHRVSYELYKGPIPEGMCVCHSCDNPSCVNPEHLFLGTHTDNMRDKVAKGRAYTGNHKGAVNGSAKLTPELVKGIRVAEGSCKEVAQQYGTSPMNVSLIKRRLAWGHVV